MTGERSVTMHYLDEKNEVCTKTLTGFGKVGYRVEQPGYAAIFADTKTFIVPLGRLISIEQ